MGVALQDEGEHIGCLKPFTRDWPRVKTHSELKSPTSLHPENITPSKAIIGNRFVK